MPGLNEARSTRRRAVTLVPIAIASAAITAQVATLGGPALAPLAAGEHPTATTFAPIRPSVPQAAIEAPASLSAATAGEGTQSTAGSAGSIPAAALAAYQRADVVINDADAVCGMPWEIVAAIGRIESDHGRVGSSSLDSNGVAIPAIYGIALDGRNNTRAIADTDAGRYDQDTEWDRAVGPMQFIPSTWSQVGVDGDADGRRDPQDIDDAALAAAVYLCAGDDDLSSEDGQRAALFRYNHSTAYVDKVMAVMAAYMAGDWSANGTTSASARVDDPTAPVAQAQGPRRPVPVAKESEPTAEPTRSTAEIEPTQQPTARPTRPTRAPVETTTRPTAKPTTPTRPKPPKPKPNDDPVEETTTRTGELVQEVTKPLKPVVTPATEPVLSLTDALDLCGRELDTLPDPLGLRALLKPLLEPARTLCANQVVGKPLAEATALIPNTLRGLLVWLGLV